MSKHLWILLGLLWLSASAKAEYFTIDLYRIDIRVDPSGEMIVEETIDVNFFSERHGIFRTIPYRYSLDGKTHKIKIRKVEVEGWPSEKSWDWYFLTLKIGDANRYVSGPQRYVIRYKVRDAWLFEENHTEFYWNMTGNQWEVPISKVEYRIEFANSPKLAEGDYQVYTGAKGEQGKDAIIHYRGGAVGGQSLREFNPGEGLTVAVRLPVDYIRRPTEMEMFLQKYGLLAIPVSLLAMIFGLWWRHGKDEKGVLMVQYYPPKGISPSEAGGFIDDSIDNRDLICLIPHWGANGYLEMTEKESQGILFKKKDYSFKKLKNLEGQQPSYEQTVFNGLFSGRTDVELSDLKDTFYTTMAAAKTQLKWAIKERMLYTPTSRQLYQALPFIAFLSVPLAILFFIKDQAPAGIGMIVLAIAALILRRPMLRWTTNGSEIYQHLRGFKEFIRQADRPRLEKLLQEDPTYFDKTLPYAIAFNMASEWGKKFDGLFTEPPSWYHGYYVGGHYGSNFGSFAQDFTGSMQEVQSVFTSMPSSSGSGGSGGGFSGGGFGGGGGGSW